MLLPGDDVVTSLALGNVAQGGHEDLAPVEGQGHEGEQDRALVAGAHGEGRLQVAHATGAGELLVDGVGIVVDGHGVE